DHRGCQDSGGATRAAVTASVPAGRLQHRIDEFARPSVEMTQHDGHDATGGFQGRANARQLRSIRMGAADAEDFGERDTRAHSRATRAEVCSRSTTGATRTEVCSRSTAALRDRRVPAEHNRAMRTECDRSTTEPCEPGVIAGARRRAAAGAHLDDAANRSTARRAHTRERPGGVGLPGRSPQTNREVSRAGPAAVPLPAPRAAWPT